MIFILCAHCYLGEMEWIRNVAVKSLYLLHPFHAFYRLRLAFSTVRFFRTLHTNDTPIYRTFNDTDIHAFLKLNLLKRASLSKWRSTTICIADKLFCGNPLKYWQAMPVAALSYYRCKKVVPL